MKRVYRKIYTPLLYAGAAGTTSSCKDAVMRFIQFRDPIASAVLLTAPLHEKSKQHAFLLVSEEGDVTAVKSGFASGYLGEGPTGLSQVLQLFHFHKIPVEEIEISEEMMARLDDSALTKRDIRFLERKQKSHPSALTYYVDHDRDDSEGRVWGWFPAVMPHSLIDQRIVDLAVNFFSDPDKALITAYKRLEDIVRKRISSAEHGVKLFQEAFLNDNSVLTWPDLAVAEVKGRAQLFVGVYMGFRNPRAHKEFSSDSLLALQEFLTVNHLYKLEAVSVLRPDP